ncbi:hypothetical protein GOP47_0014560 [Adiantum capillus-veneris]|uniref:Uncharacterized protein n=1 Tax=Adiantum capillus-veneris TaxID=13818 RepID=A0A9D4UM10_ADICA|nr:hypothetical protein GOP47_0014560 [Adiantum capillus-veneris]
MEVNATVGGPWSVNEGHGGGVAAWSNTNRRQYVEPWIEVGAYEARIACDCGCASWSSSNNRQYVDLGGEARLYKACTVGDDGGAAIAGHYVELDKEATPTFVVGTAASSMSIYDGTQLLLLQANVDVFYRRSVVMKPV